MEAVIWVVLFVQAAIVAVMWYAWRSITVMYDDIRRRVEIQEKRIDRARQNIAERTRSKPKSPHADQN
jgi:hypothetical protein